MIDRSELVEAALDVYPEAVALLDTEQRVVFWNRAAEDLTGYAGADVVGRSMPPGLEGLTSCQAYDTQPELRGQPDLRAGSPVHAQHKRGHDIPTVARTVVLRDGLGRRIGTAAVFHGGESLNALPHGASGDENELRQTVAAFEERLEFAFEAFRREGAPLGLLWIAVDQAPELRKTHGARACETMVESMERTLANGLRPGEEIGRWGCCEFLIIAREADGRVLSAHAQVLAGLARTTTFRWWGDRVSLTVSVGVAVIQESEELASLLRRAQDAMDTSRDAGGNHITLAGRFS